MVRLRFWKSLCWIGLCSWILGCVRDAPDKPLPQATGKLNELSIVMDTTWWQNEMGQAVRQRFAVAFPLLSPPEPLFKSQYFTPQRFLSNPKYLAHRNCLLIIRKYTSDPQEQALAKIIESRLTQEQLSLWRSNQVFSLDKVWADPQRIMVIAVETPQQALQLWETYYPSIYQKIRDNEAQVHQTSWLRKKADESVRLKVWNNQQVDMDFPKGTQVLSSSDSTTWLHYPYPDGSGQLWLLFRQTTLAEMHAAGSAPELILQQVLQRTPSPSGMGAGKSIRIEDKNPALYSQTIPYQKMIAAVEWRGAWSLGAKTGPFIAQLPHFPPGAPVLLAGFVEINPGWSKVEKILALQYLLQRQRTERKP